MKKITMLRLRKYEKSTGAYSFKRLGFFSFQLKVQNFEQDCVIYHEKFSQVFLYVRP